MQLKNHYVKQNKPDLERQIQYFTSYIESRFKITGVYVSMRVYAVHKTRKGIIRKGEIY